jgi:hypothetical protein
MKLIQPSIYTTLVLSTIGYNSCNKEIVNYKQNSEVIQRVITDRNDISWLIESKKAPYTINEALATFKILKEWSEEQAWDLMNESEGGDMGVRIFSYDLKNVEGLSSVSFSVSSLHNSETNTYVLDEKKVTSILLNLNDKEYDLYLFQNGKYVKQ